MKANCAKIIINGFVIMATLLLVAIYQSVIGQDTTGKPYPPPKKDTKQKGDRKKQVSVQHTSDTSKTGGGKSRSIKFPYLVQARDLICKMRYGTAIRTGSGPNDITYREGPCFRDVPEAGSETSFWTPAIEKDVFTAKIRVPSGAKVFKAKLDVFVFQGNGGCKVKDEQGKYKYGGIAIIYIGYEKGGIDHFIWPSHVIPTAPNWPTENPVIVNIPPGVRELKLFVDAGPSGSPTAGIAPHHCDDVTWNDATFYK